MAIKKWSDDEIISLIRPDMEAADQIQQVLGEQREEYYNRYRMEEYGNEREGFSHTVAATVFSAHKWTMANLMEIFSEDFFVLKSDNEAKANALQKLIFHQMFKMQDGYKKFYDNLFNAALYHYSVIKTCYVDDFKLEDEKYPELTMEEMQQLTSDPNVQVTKFDQNKNDDGSTSFTNVKVVRKAQEYKGPKFEVIPPWEFFYSPDCKLTDWGGVSGRLVYQKVTRTLNEVRKREKAGIYRKGTYDECLTKAKTNINNYEEHQAEVLFNADDIPAYDIQEPSNQPDNELSTLVEIKECYFNLDIDNDGLLEPVVVDIIGDSVVARIEENPYNKAPFRIGHLHPEPHKINGISLASILENDQKIETNLVRLIQDAGALDCYRNPVTKDQAMFNMLQTRKPFSPIKGDPNSVGEIKTSPPSQFVLKAYEMLKSANEEKTGITRYNQGMDASSLNKTATGIDAIMSASAKPLRLIAKLIGNGQIKGLLKDFIYINSKFPPVETMQNLGIELELNPNDLTASYDVEIDVGVGVAEKNAMANQMDLFVQFATQAGLNMGIVTPIGVIRAQKKKYRLLGIKMDDCLVDEKQFEQMQAEKQKQPPPPPDLKQYCQLDKLFPYLTPMEQSQILEHFEIKPDPRRMKMPATAMSGESPIDMIRMQQEIENQKRGMMPNGQPPRPQGM